MSTASIKKIISCKKKQLVEMVLDIEKYPDLFLGVLKAKFTTKMKV